MDLLVAFVALGLPVLLGVVAGAARLFDDAEAAVGHLNRYALYLAFPLLVFVALAGARFAVPADVAFWVAVSASLAVSVAACRLASRSLGRLRGDAGSLALVTIFGNVAYLGLPVVERVLGAERLGLAALVVAVHVTVSLVAGPILLLRWQDGGSAAISLGPAIRRALGQPLLWAPLAGLAGRLLPDGVRGFAVDAVRPVAASAGPVALFLLGLHLWTHRSRLRGMDPTGLVHVAAKLLVVPAVTAAFVLPALEAGWIRDDAARVVLLLSAMPTAITSFAIAREFGTGVDRVAQAVVASTLASLATLPVVALLLR